jgi:putative PIN family toxin of toxin-antitoxin system
LVSQDVLLEYEEILTVRANPIIAKTALSLLHTLPTVEKVHINFKWEAIQVDKDDNKFVDTAFNGNADFLVTNDKHFDIVKHIEFPSVEIVDLNTFLQMISK